MGMAQCFLDEGEISTISEKMRGIRMLEHMWIDSARLDACEFRTLAKQIVDLLPLEAGPLATDKQERRTVSITAFAQAGSESEFFI